MGTSPVSGEVIGGTIRRNVNAKEQLILDIDDLIDRDNSDNVVIEVTSSVPVYVQGYSQYVGSEFPLVSPAPIASMTMQGNIANIPRVQFGGGYQSEILLMNPGEEALTGQIIVHGGRDGDLSDNYSIAPGGVYRWLSGAQSGLARTGYVTIHSDGNTLPAGGARISLLDGEQLVTRSYVPTGQISRRVWIPVDNNPSTTRHGRISVNFHIVNNGAQVPAGASVRLNLFSPNGSFVQRFEQIIPIGEQWDISLVELAKSDRFRGSVRIASDVPVSVSATQVTENINGDLIEMELPIVDENTATIGRPLLLDGEGLASEIILLNTDQSEVEGEFEFYSANGDSTELILR